MTIIIAATDDTVLKEHEIASLILNMVQWQSMTGRYRQATAIAVNKVDF